MEKIIDERQTELLCAVYKNNTNKQDGVSLLRSLVYALDYKNVEKEVLNAYRLIYNRHDMKMADLKTAVEEHTPEWFLEYQKYFKNVNIKIFGIDKNEIQSVLYVTNGVHRKPKNPFVDLFIKETDKGQVIGIIRDNNKIQKCHECRMTFPNIKMFNRHTKSTSHKIKVGILDNPRDLETPNVFKKPEAVATLLMERFPMIFREKLFLDNYVFYDTECSTTEAGKMEIISFQCGDNLTHTCTYMDFINVKRQGIDLVQELVKDIKKRSIAIQHKYKKYTLTVGEEYITLLQKNKDDFFISSITGNEIVIDLISFIGRHDNKLLNYFLNIPVLCYNSKFDINLIKDKFFHELEIQFEVPCNKHALTVKNNSFLSYIIPGKIQMLDIYKYTGCSLEKFMKTYLKGTIYEGKIYKLYINHKLHTSSTQIIRIANMYKDDETHLPPMKMWSIEDSHNPEDCPLSEEAYVLDVYNRILSFCQENGIKNYYHYFKQYSINDVSGAMRAIDAFSHLMHKVFGLNIFKDAITLSSLAMKYCMLSVYKPIVDGAKENYDRIKMDSEGTYELAVKLRLRENTIEERLNSYYNRDIEKILKKLEEAKKDVDKAKILEYEGKLKTHKQLTMENYINILQKSNFKCEYCLKKCDCENLLGLDAMINYLYHIEENCVACCRECNTLKNKKSHTTFLNKMLLTKFTDKQLIYTLRPKDAELFRKNVFGGRSCIFNRHAGVGSKIINHMYDTNEKEMKIEGGEVKWIRGDDGNSLYPTAMLGMLPTGDIQFTDVWGLSDEVDAYFNIPVNMYSEDDYTNGVPYNIEDARKLKGKFFGFVLCDFEHIKEEWERVSLMPVITIHKEMDPSDKKTQETHKYMFEKGLITDRDMKREGELTSVMRGKNRLMFSTCLEYYVRNLGLRVKNVRAYAPAQPNRIFHDLMIKLSMLRNEAVLKGDSTTSAIIKLVMNATYGQLLLNNKLFTNEELISCSTSADYDKLFEMKNSNKLKFKESQLISSINGKEIFRVATQKYTIYDTAPSHFGYCVLELARLHMDRYFYEFLDKYLSRECYIPILTDTDSLICAYTDKDLTKCVKPGLEKEFIEASKKWLIKSGDTVYGEDPKNLYAGTSSLTFFKNDCNGIEICAVVPKVYCIKPEGDKPMKVRNKGVSLGQNHKFRDTAYQNMLNTLYNELIEGPEVVSNNIICNSKQAVHYKERKKVSYSNNYTKRIVLGDGIHTIALIE